MFLGRCFTFNLVSPCPPEPPSVALTLNKMAAVGFWVNHPLPSPQHSGLTPSACLASQLYWLLSAGCLNLCRGAETDVKVLRSSGSLLRRWSPPRFSDQKSSQPQVRSWKRSKWAQMVPGQPCGHPCAMLQRKERCSKEQAVWESMCLRWNSVTKKKSMNQNQDDQKRRVHV